MTDSSKSIDDLHPVFKPLAKAILEEAQRRMGPTGRITLAQTFRSMSDQMAAKAAGKSKVQLGWHQFGLAFDVAIISPEGLYIADGDDGRYALVGTVAQERGCVWGGNWVSFKDAAHVEWHPGFSLAQYVAWLDAHRVTTA